MTSLEDYQIAIKLINGLLLDRELNNTIPDEIASIPEFMGMYRTIKELRQAIMAMGSGNLDYVIKEKGFLPGTLKGFQASLRHLTWQTQAIASGDFTQRVDFMGDFSESFNKMTHELDSATNALRKSEEKYRLLTEFASDVIWVWNLNLNKFTYISPSIFCLRGLTAEEAKQESMEETLAAESFAHMQEAIARNVLIFKENPDVSNNYIDEVQQPTKNGALIWVEVSTQYRYNEVNEIEIVGVSRNIEARKRADNEIRYLSYHDQLTGFYNRRFYEEELVKIDIESNLPISLVMADVNGLKLTNDAFGHLAGDSLLKNIADIMKSICRADDILARTGGDEFVILLLRTDILKANEIVKCICESLDRQGTEKTVLSVSFGVSTKNKVEEDLNNIFTAAEDQMYHHKLTGSSSMKRRMIQMITDSLFEKDESERKHCERVGAFCKKTAQALNMSKEAINALELAGTLHDIGKIGIDEKILKKREKLTESDWSEVQRHPEIGYQILRSSNEFAHIAEYVLSHHEQPDGKGYPRGITDIEIPYESKIVAIAEAYDSMVNQADYKDAISEDQAIQILKENSGSKFDPEITKIFIEKVLGKE